MGVPHSCHSWMVKIPLKWMIWGYPHLWKPPNRRTNEAKLPEILQVGPGGRECQRRQPLLNADHRVLHHCGPVENPSISKVRILSLLVGKLDELIKANTRDCRHVPRCRVMLVQSATHLISTGSFEGHAKTI